MLDPDVTDLLTDPDIGGGVFFTVTRNTYTRKLAENVLQSSKTMSCGGGNVQFQSHGIMPNANEDTTTESLVIRSTFQFQTGQDDGVTFTEADVVSVYGRVWRVTQVEDWTPWGFTIAYATLRRLEGDGNALQGA